MERGGEEVEKRGLVGLPHMFMAELRICAAEIEPWRCMPPGDAWNPTAPGDCCS